MRSWVESGVVAAIVMALLAGVVLLVPGNVRADPGIDYIRVVDAPNGNGTWVSERNYTFGDNDTFWAAGYNATTGDWVQDVSVYWLFTQSGPAIGNKVVRLNSSYGSTVKLFTNGYGVATVHVQGRGGLQNLTNDTGPLRVSVDNVGSVIIRNEPGGAGTWVGDTTYQSGQSDKFYAAGYDSGGGFLGDIVSNWSSTDRNVTYLPGLGQNGCFNTGGTNSVSCYPHMLMYANRIGYAWVNATPVHTSVTNVTGKLTVNGTGIDYVTIRNAPHGYGAALGNFTYYEREQDTLYAASYNNTYGYRGDVVGDWTTNDTAVCKVNGYSGNTAHGSSVQLLLLRPGTCTVTVNATTISGPVSNTTGTLAVLQRTTFTVDGNGGRDYTKIQDAVDAASDGYRIEVYPSTYDEHVVVAKELEIVGMNRTSVVLDGNGTGEALRLEADRAVIHNFTIQDAATGVFNNATNNTRLYYMTIKDYGVGVNNSYTLNAWVAYNLIKNGEIGVVAYKAYDDAIRWNEIAYNTKYGGKGYNAHLRNCFNWNYLHDNGKGYYYDPTTELPPMEFDGNTLTDNDVGVLVEASSAIRVTRNAISGGSEGVQLLDSSSEVWANAITGVDVGVRFVASNSNITDNTIAARDVGIVGNGGSPRIEGNDITVTSGEAMSLANLDGAVIAGNDVHGGTIRITDSRIALLAPVNAVVVLEDSTVDRLVLDATSRVEVSWTARVAAMERNGNPAAGTSVTVRDVRGNVAYQGVTGADGLTPPFLLTVEVRTSSSVDARNPFTFEANAGGRQAAVTATVDAAMDVVVTVPPAPLWLVAATAALMLASALFTGVVAVERSRYAFLALFVPLYTRLDRDDPLKNLNRGRVFEYIELNPGAHFNAILAALDLNNGTLVHHLEVLQKDGFVTSRQDGMYRRFYPRGVPLPVPLENGTSEAQLRILKVVQEMPGITQKELGRFLGLRQSTLAYQMDRLGKMGYVTSEKRGRKVHYTAKDGGAHH